MGDSMPSMTIHSGLFRSVLCSALDLSVLNMEGNFGTFLTDDFFSYILNRNPFHKLATLDISFNDQGGVSGRVSSYFCNHPTVVAVRPTQGVEDKRLVCDG